MSTRAASGDTNTLLESTLFLQNGEKILLFSLQIEKSFKEKVNIEFPFKEFP